MGEQHLYVAYTMLEIASPPRSRHANASSMKQIVWARTREDAEAAARALNWRAAKRNPGEDDWRWEFEIAEETGQVSLGAELERRAEHWSRWDRQERAKHKPWSAMAPSVLSARTEPLPERVVRCKRIQGRPDAHPLHYVEWP